MSDLKTGQSLLELREPVRPGAALRAPCLSAPLQALLQGCGAVSEATLAGPSWHWTPTHSAPLKAPGSAARSVGPGADCPRVAPPGQRKWSPQRPCGFLGRLQRLSVKKKKKFLKHRKAIQEKRKTKSFWLKQCTVCVFVVVGGCGFFVLKTCRGKGDKRLWPQPLWPLCSEHLSGEDGEGQGREGLAGADPAGGRRAGIRWSGCQGPCPCVHLPGLSYFHSRY